MAAKKTAAKKMTKTAFVRGLPSDTPAAEVVEKAKAAGIKITPAYVYNIRSVAGAGKGKTTTSGGAASSAAPKRKGRPSEAKAVELLRAIVSQLGIGRTMELLEAEALRVLKALG